MSKISLTDLVNLQNETTAVNAINTNNQVLRLAVDNTLSRDGTSPNQMNANLDMNSNRVVNLPLPLSGQEPVRLLDLASYATGGSVTFSPLPTGGTTSQVLTKVSNTDYNVNWQTIPPSLPVGGTTGQVLNKTSNTDFAVGWVSPTVGYVSSFNGQTGAIVSYYAPQGRLTLSTLVPVMATSVAGATVVYYTPYAGNIV